MCCRVERCISSNFHYNPLIAPLLNFHGTILALGDDLPRDGKVAEIAKRIGYAAASPFAYLALSFLALAGLILNGIWKRGASSEGMLPATAVLKTQFGKTSHFPTSAFGKTEWEKAFPVTVDELPLLFDIDAILEQEDPCEPGKKLKETCQLFFRPEKITLHEQDEDKDILLTFSGVEELAMKATNPNNRAKYGTLVGLRAQMDQIPTLKAGWVLMRKELIPGTKNKSFEEQQNLLKGSFAVPTLMDAIFLNIITYAKDGKYLYGTNTYIRCKETYNGLQTLVGGFEYHELYVGTLDYFCPCEYQGLTGAWGF